MLVGTAFACSWEVTVRVREVAVLRNQATGRQSGAKVSATICLSTQRMCLDTARYCTELGGKYAERQFIRLLLDTAALCHTTMDTIYRTNWIRNHTTSACAAMCARVAEACDNFPGDEQMMRCARLCRDCVKFCVEVNTVTLA